MGEDFYNTLTKTDEYYSCERKEMLKYIPYGSSTILDVGCATGNFGESLKKLFGAEVWGIEAHIDSAMKASMKLNKVITGDIQTSINELPQNYFDCIVFNDVLEHLTDPYNVLKEINGKLKKDGSIVASIPNVRYVINLKELLWNKDWQYKDNGILDYDHYRFFTKKSIVRMFQDAGYNLVLIEGINAIDRKILFTIFNIFTFGILSDSKYLQFACAGKKL